MEEGICAEGGVVCTKGGVVCADGGRISIHIYLALSGLFRLAGVWLAAYQILLVVVWISQAHEYSVLTLSSCFSRKQSVCCSFSPPYLLRPFDFTFFWSGPKKLRHLADSYWWTCSLFTTDIHDINNHVVSYFFLSFPPLGLINYAWTTRQGQGRSY